MTNSLLDFLELSRHLKQERLYVGSEREHLISLHTAISANAERLYHSAWITRQQKSALGHLILGNNDSTPASCCQQVNAVELVAIADGYRRLTYHETKIGKLLKQLHDAPKLLAVCLANSEVALGFSVDAMQRVACIIISGIYGNVIMPDDETNVLLLLKHLIEIQVARSDDPSRLLRRGSCAFSTVFRLLTESQFSARIFLTAALHHPVMQLLMEDEWFYDIDPDRALHRFPPAERMRRFGTPGSKEYERSIKIYREQITNKLVALVTHFISSIQASMYCFPSSLAWIVSQLYHSLIKDDAMPTAQARAICADLIVASFICPAVCDPEPYGITSDAPISYIARHNLMQVGQILQVLTVSSGDEAADSKAKDLYSKFPKGCMSFVLDTLLDVPYSGSLPASAVSMAGFCRSSLLLSCTELIELLTFVHRITETLNEDMPERKQLEDMLASSNTPPISVLTSLCSVSQRGSSGLIGSAHASPNTTPQPTPPGTPSSMRKAPKLIQSVGKEKRRMFLAAPGSEGHVDNGGDSEGGSNGSPSHHANIADELLVISLGISNDCPGMLPELKVLEQECGTQGRQKKVKYNSVLPGEDDPVCEPDNVAHEKRTRFSLSHDQDSIATSDNLEAISEAASSHSVGSDLDNENDNLSDMVSANVSGRGTPNVSGRDTPISQADSQMEGGAEGGETEAEEQPRPAAPNLPVTVQKTNRVDVTERFGKFEIRQELERDDIKSVVSDTWSTDVIASDSEPPEQNQLERLEEVIEEPAANLLGVNEAVDMSEIASDAWSTDVLASDTSERQSERLLELDQDDMASVSGRSVGIGSEAGDLIDVASDDTSQASVPVKQSSHPGVIMRASSAVKQEGPSSNASLSPRSQRPILVKDVTDGLADIQLEADAADLLLVNSTEVENGGFQMDRYIRDDHVPSQGEGSLANQSTDQGVDSNILQAFDPLGYADTNRKSTDEVDSDDALSCSLSSSVLKGAASDICISLGPNDSVGNIERAGTTQWATGSVGSLVDLGVEALGPSMTLGADGGSLVSVNTLVAKDASSTETMSVNADQPMVAAAGAAAPESNIWSKNASLNSMPRISVSHLAETGARLKSALLAPGNSRASDATSKSAAVVTDAADSDGGGDDNASFGSAANSNLSPRTTGRAASAITTSPAGLLDDDERKLLDKRKTGGLFHNFRERLSKGGFAVTGPVNKGGKRKTAPKALDRDDVFRSSAEADRGLMDGSSSVRVVVPTACDSGDDLPSKNRSSGGNSLLAKQDETLITVDTTEDILAKYRKPVGIQKPSNGSAAAATVTESGSVAAAAGVAANKDREQHRIEDDDSVPTYDSNNLENCKAFIDAKRKLRLILSNVDFQMSLPSSCPAVTINGTGCRYSSNLSSSVASTSALSSTSSSSAASEQQPKDNDLVLQLKVQLAEAINLQDCDLVAQLLETIRCLQQFDNHEIRKLLKIMREEYRTRSVYIAYLARCRQGLLSSLAFVDRLVVRVNRDKTMVNKHLLSVLVRLFLEKHEMSIQKFVAEFAKLTVSDEKADMVENYLNHLHQLMENDEMWQAANASQLDEAKLYAERSVMSRIYTQAMFPNGDADVMRDQILHEHMQKLAKVITPFHKDLRIPKIYQYECPWPAAQTHIYQINVYKTPKDKLQCILRCSSTIMNLLSMASDRSVPAADDFMPVLIYVLIKSGATLLLSNVQFVRDFYEKRLSGEEQYWWMQFVSAIEFIKTMDYSE